jgi:hypothetical protein
MEAVLQWQAIWLDSRCLLHMGDEWFLVRKVFPAFMSHSTSIIAFNSKGRYTSYGQLLSKCRNHKPLCLLFQLHVHFDCVHPQILAFGSHMEGY